MALAEWRQKATDRWKLFRMEISRKEEYSQMSFNTKLRYRWVENTSKPGKTDEKNTDKRFKDLDSWYMYDFHN